MCQTLYLLKFQINSSVIALENLQSNGKSNTVFWVRYFCILLQCNLSLKQFHFYSTLRYSFKICILYAYLLKVLSYETHTVFLSVTTLKYLGHYCVD